MDTRSDLSAALRSHLRETLCAPPPHPTAEELAAYHADQLPPVEDAALREHLVRCEECSALVLELAELSESSAKAATENTEFEAAAAWRRQRPRILAALRSAAPTTITASARWAWAAAACLALVSLTLGIWVTDLRETVDDLRGPRINPPLVNLEPQGAVRHPPAAVPTMELSDAAPRGWLILNAVEDSTYPSYRIELIAVDGLTRWSAEKLRRSEAGNFRLELTRETVPAGRYRILLSGQRDGRTEPIAEFQLRISHR